MLIAIIIISQLAHAAHRDIPGCLNSIGYADSVKLARGDFLLAPKKGAFTCEETECCCWDGFDPETSNVQLDQYGHCEITVNLQRRSDKLAKKAAAEAAVADRKSRIDALRAKLKVQDLSLAEQNELLRLERGL